MNLKCKEIKDIVNKNNIFLKKENIVLNEDQNNAVESLYEEADRILIIVKNDTNLTSLLKDDDKLLQTLAKRFDFLFNILCKSKLYNCLNECEFVENLNFRLAIDTLKRDLKTANSLEFLENVLEVNYKKLKQDKNKLVRFEGMVLKFTLNFLKAMQLQISSILSSTVISTVISADEYSNKDKDLKLVSDSLKKFCPDKYNLLVKNGVFGSAFIDTDQISKMSVFNYDDSGNIIIDSKCYTQGIIKNCYFIAALRSLSNNPNAVKYLRNCFDKMTDDDLKFTDEKTSQEKMNKKFIIGFFNIDFDSLSVDELQHLGLMNKTSAKIKCTSNKTYYEVRCKDLLAAGIEPKGNELWPLLLENAWGRHLVNISTQLEKIKDRLPFKYKHITDTDSQFPQVAEVIGDNNVVSLYAHNMYTSMALATLTGKSVSVKPIDPSENFSDRELLNKLGSLKDKRIMTVFKGRKNNSGEDRSSTKCTDAITGKTFMLFSGHAVSVKDLRAVKGRWIVELHDTMNSIGDNGVFHLTLEDFKEEFDNIVTAKA